MKRRLLVAALAASLLAGCCAIDVTNRGGRLMCDVDNSCLFLFIKIPLFSGDTNMPNQSEFICFEDTTTLENNMRLIRREMDARHAHSVQNLTSFRTEEQVFFFILKRSTLHTSAELVKAPLQ